MSEQTKSELEKSAEAAEQDAALRRKKILKIAPRGDFVLLTRIPMPEDRMTDGGIFLPNEVFENNEQRQPTALGIVAAIGDTVNDGKPDTDPTLIRIGGKVVFNPWPMNGCTISTDGGLTAQVLVKESDIYGNFSLEEPTEEDIAKMKQFRELQRQREQAASRPRLVLPDDRLVVP